MVRPGVAWNLYISLGILRTPVNLLHRENSAFLSLLVGSLRPIVPYVEMSTCDGHRDLRIAVVCC
jgi:hypothetical protein